MLAKTRIFTSSDGWITAVAARTATVESRGRALDAWRCARILGDLRRNAPHDLVALYEAATGIALHAPRDVSASTLVAAIESAISKGRLILVPGRGERHLGTEETRLLKTVMGTLTAIELEGRRYRFALSERGVAQGGADYRPVPDGEAAGLLARMAKQMAKTTDERAAWQRLIALVSGQRHGAARDGGIVLMRYAPPRGPVAKPDVPAVTPAQARGKLAEQDWIEIQIVYEDGSPFDGSCVVVLPDGRQTEGPPDGDGVVRIDGVDPGSCKLSFPQLDAAVWAPG